MPEPARTDRPLAGIALMLVAMAMFTVTDTLAKYLTAELTSVEIVWSRHFFYVFLLAPLVLRRGVRRTFATPHLQAQIWRSVCLLLSATAFTISLVHLPLAFATTIAFVSPFFVTGLSMVFLGEKVGPRRWGAIAVGFIGVLIVVRPAGDFSIWSLMPILAAFLWAIGLILTRRAGSTDSPLTTLVYTTIFGLLVSTVLTIPVWIWPTPEAWALMLFIAAWNLVGLTLMIKAFAFAPASTLAPFGYSQMLWSTLMGFAVFGDVPDLYTYLGGAVIVASGVYVWHRERVLARSQRA